MIKASNSQVTGTHVPLSLPTFFKTLCDCALQMQNREVQQAVIGALREDPVFAQLTNTSANVRCCLVL